MTQYQRSDTVEGSVNCYLVDTPDNPVGLRLYPLVGFLYHLVNWEANALLRYDRLLIRTALVKP